MKFLTAVLPLVLGLPWLLFLPGLVTQLWFVTRWSSLRRQDWLETVFVSLLFSLCVTGWLGLLLVEVGWFDLSRLLLLVLAYTLGLAWSLRGKEVGRAWRRLWTFGDRSQWLLLGILLLGIVLYFHPHEYVLGGSDAGVYVNLGAHISRSGTLVFRDPELAALDVTFYPALFRAQPSHLITRYIQFPGFYLSDQQAGLVIPQFYPLHPVWLAIFHSLGGVRASLYATPLWGVLALLAVGLTTRTLFGSRVGVLAMLFLAVSATQIWFARYPTSELLTQLLLFGGIYTFSRYMTSRSPMMGLLAGLALGQVMLVRLDTYFLLAIPLVLVAYLWLTRQLGRRHLIFLIPFFALSLHSLLHGRLQSWPYLYNSYHYQLVALPLELLAAAGVVLLVGFLVLDLWVNGRAARWSRLSRWVDWGATAVAVAVVLAALYAYFIRPRQANLGAEIAYWYAERTIPYVEPYNLVRLGWYFSPLGIALAVLGVWWMLRHALSRQTALFLGVGLFFSFLYLQNSRNNPHHIYVMRRYVPAVLPTFAIAAAYGIARWWHSPAKGRRLNLMRWLAWGLTVAQMALLLYAARIVVRQVDYRGLWAQLVPWAESLPPDAVILFDDDRPVSTGATVGTSLRYLFDYTVFDLQEEYLTAEVLEELVDTWQAQGRRVLVAVGPYGVREPFVNWSFSPLPALWLDAPVLESSYLHFPRRVQRSKVSLGLYELLPAADASSHPFRIDVGASDLFYLDEGWHGKQRLADGTTIRWTSDAARYRLPASIAGQAGAELRLRLAASTHSGKPSAPVELRYCAQISACDTVEEAVTLAQWQATSSFREYRVVLPEGPSAFWLQTVTWNPAAMGLGADARDLGVMVDWIRVE